jgi:hypothetical protein
LLHPERIEAGSASSLLEATDIAPASGEVAVRVSNDKTRVFAAWVVGPVEPVLGALNELGRADLIQSIRARVA